MQLLDSQLIAFMAIVEQQTVHAAAESLHITQTAVTRRLKNLEQKLGVSLFIRSRRGMALTTEGEALWRYCQSTQVLAGETLAQITGTGINSSVRIALAGPSSIMESRILPAINELVTLYPQVLLEMIYRDDEEIVPLLKTGTVQFAILPEEQIAKEMQSKMLTPEIYVLVASKKWKGRRLNDILKNERIVDFSPIDNMTFNYLKHFSLFEKIQHERHFVNHPEAIVKMISTEKGYSVLEKVFVEPFLRKGDLILLNKGKSYANQIGLAWYDRPHMPNYLQDLIKTIS